MRQRIMKKVIRKLDIKEQEDLVGKDFDTVVAEVMRVLDGEEVPEFLLEIEPE